jgi:hypothetical protein
MALYTRQTKTRISTLVGKITAKGFIADKNIPALNISIETEDGKTHSITLYGEEKNEVKKWFTIPANV